MAAAEVCLGPCASPRQKKVGTHAQRLGLWFHAVVCHQLHRKELQAEGAENGWE